MNNLASWLAAALVLSGMTCYWVSIVRGKTEAKKASWIIWGTLDTIAMLGMMLEHSANGQVVASVIGCWVTIALTLRYGQSGWTVVDRLCLAIVGLSLMFWAWRGNTVGVSVSLFGILVATIPTVLGALKNPQEEDLWTWILFTAAGVPVFVTMPAWDVIHAAQPLVFTGTDALVLTIIVLHPKEGWLKRGLPKKKEPLNPPT